MIDGVTATTVLADLRKRLSVIQDAYVLTIPPPPVQGIGNAGGFKMMLQDRAGLGSDALARAAQTLVAAANRDPHFAGVFTLFNTRSPSIYADIDREKAEKVGLTPTDVFSTLQVYLGSQYVNDFNYLGRTYEVIAQADGSFRRDANDIGRLKARNTSGEMVPIGTVAELEDETDPYRVPRYNLSRLPKSGRRRARHRDRHGAAPDGGTGPPGAAARHRFRMDRACFPAAAARDADGARVRRGRAVRVPGARRTIRELETAARGGADRADVPARFRDRPAVARDADRHPGSDRLRRSRGPGRQERDPDRRVRAPGANRRAQPQAKPRCARRAHGFVRSS